METTNVIITGASSGIGAALAKVYAQAGWNVGLVARRALQLEETAAKCRIHEGQIIAVTADVRSQEQISSAISKIEDAQGHTSICIAAAGLSALETDLSSMDTVRAVYETNLLGTLNTFHAVLPGMKQARSGHLVAISSLAAVRGLPRHGSYCGSKRALNTHCDALRPELKKHKINLTAIHPGFVYTPMIDHLHPPKLLCVSAQTAANRIKSAVDRNRPSFSFPLSALILSKICQWIPESLIERISAVTARNHS